MSVRRGNLFPTLRSDGSFSVGSYKGGIPQAPCTPPWVERSRVTSPPGHLEVGSWPVHLSSSSPSVCPPSTCGLNCSCPGVNIATKTLDLREVPLFQQCLWKDG